MAQKQQDFPILVSVADSNLYEETELVIAATGRSFERVAEIDPTSAKFRRAPAVIIEDGSRTATQSGLESLTSGPAVLLVCRDEIDADADGSGVDCYSGPGSYSGADGSGVDCYRLPADAIELVMRIGRSGPVAPNPRAGGSGEDHVGRVCDTRQVRGAHHASGTHPRRAGVAYPEPDGVAVGHGGGPGGHGSGDGHGGGPGGHGAAIVVASAVGASGASTFAATLSQSFARHYPTCLIDADEYSGGADLLLGMESSPGVRWSDIRADQGRLDGNALFCALPGKKGIENLRVLTSTRHRGSDTSGPTPDTLVSVIDALVRDETVAIVDTPRHLLLDEALLQRVDCVIVVVALSLRGVAAAEKLCTQLRRQGIEPVILSRAEQRNDIESQDLEFALGAQVRAELPYQKGLAHEINIGGLGAGAQRILRASQSLIDDLVYSIGPRQGQ